MRKPLLYLAAAALAGGAIPVAPAIAYAIQPMPPLCTPPLVPDARYGCSFRQPTPVQDIPSQPDQQCSTNPLNPIIPNGIPSCGTPCGDSRIGPGGVVEYEPPGCDPRAPRPDGSHAE
jgi:hypothetical protein